MNAVLKDEVEQWPAVKQEFEPEGRSAYKIIKLEFRAEVSYREFMTDHDPVNASFFMLQVIAPAKLKEDEDNIEQLAGAVDAQVIKLETELHTKLEQLKATAREEAASCDGSVNIERLTVRSYSQGFARWAGVMQKMDDALGLVDALWFSGRIDTTERLRQHKELRVLMAKFRKTVVNERLAAMAFAGKSGKPQGGAKEGATSIRDVASEEEAIRRRNAIAIANGVATKRKRVRTKRNKVRDVTAEVVGEDATAKGASAESAAEEEEAVSVESETAEA